MPAVHLTPSEVTRLLICDGGAIGFFRVSPRHGGIGSDLFDYEYRIFQGLLQYYRWSYKVALGVGAVMWLGVPAIYHASSLAGIAIALLAMIPVLFGIYRWVSDFAACGDYPVAVSRYTKLAKKTVVSECESGGICISGLVPNEELPHVLQVIGRHNKF